MADGVGRWLERNVTKRRLGAAKAKAGQVGRSLAGGIDGVLDQLASKLAATPAGRQLTQLLGGPESVARLQRFLGNVPVLSAVSDALTGAAGIPELKESVKRLPSDPVRWLQLGQAISSRSGMRVAYRALRAPFDPLSVAASTGLQVGAQSLSGRPANISAQHCYVSAIALAKRRMRQGTRSPLDCAAAGVAYYELASDRENDQDRRRKLLQLAAEYLRTAAGLERGVQHRGEYLYWLGEVYEARGNAGAAARCWNAARWCGFRPALPRLTLFLWERRRLDSRTEQLIAIPNGVRPVEAFQLGFAPAAGGRLLGAVKNLWDQQSQKVGSVVGKAKQLR